MSDVNGIMFTPQGRPTPLLIARWRAKGGLHALMPLGVYAVDGNATAPLRMLWKVAFPGRSPLPPGPISTPEGRFTDTMLNVWLT